MSAKLPPEFHADRYLAAYPDVALSGLSPAQHYLRFGKLLGRAPGGAGAKPTSENSRPPAAVAGAPPGQMAKTQPDVVARPSRDLLIDRPQDLDPSSLVARAVVPDAEAGPTPQTDLESLSRAPLGAGADESSCLAPLLAYARLLALDAPERIAPATVAPTTGSPAFRVGAARIESAWLVGSTRLRVRLAGGGAGAAPDALGTVHAYQALADAPGRLHGAGPGVALASSGPVFHDFELRDPLMPVLLRLSGPGDTTLAVALMPFPSLLPGGLHDAERHALQTEPNPMDDFWVLSENLLRETVGETQSGKRSIARIVSIDPADPALEGQAVAPLMRAWLSTVFGIDVQTDRDAPSPGSGGLSLRLPRDCIPTVSALASRRLGVAAGRRFHAPFLVADAVTCRPRWLIVIPQAKDIAPEVPTLERTEAGAVAEVERFDLAVPVAIAFRQAHGGAAALPAPDHCDARPFASDGLTVVIDGADGPRAVALATRLKELAGDSSLEPMIRGLVLDEAESRAMDLLFGAGGWSTLSPDHDLREVAASARHPRLLTISDSIFLDDESSLSELDQVLATQPEVASAACLVVQESVIKKEVVLRPASCGLFPARVSFAAAPRLAFAEPDVSEALPNMRYPVVANSFAMTLWRTAALAGLPAPRGGTARNAADIRLGLDLLSAGFTNVCSTRAAVRLAGSYRRRDSIDPVGGGYADPDQWRQILGRVTLVRALV